MIPGWKIRRELGRLRQQLRAIPEAIWEPFARARHDRLVRAGLPHMDGKQALGPKVAIVLLFQPRGLADSLFLMCRHLAANGYAVLAVSNAPLSGADKARLADHVWRVLERPNFGYDFGGYRDAIWSLRAWGVRPERLVILNDSIWFPLRDDDDTLARMEASPFDVAGTILRERGDARFLESYFFSVRGAVLDQPVFRSFWDDLRLTSNKYKVIRRGERGFGAVLRAGGIDFGAMFPTADFDAAIAAADESTLRQTLRYMAAVDPQVQAKGAALAAAAGDPAWLSNARAFIRQVLEKAQFYSSFPVAAVTLLGYPVMKKSREPVSAKWRSAWLRAVDDKVLAAPPGPILAEARGLTDEAMK